MTNSSKLILPLIHPSRKFYANNLSQRNLHTEARILSKVIVEKNLKLRPTWNLKNVPDLSSAMSVKHISSRNLSKKTYITDSVSNKNTKFVKNVNGNYRNNV